MSNRRALSRIAFANEYLDLSDLGLTNIPKPWFRLRSNPYYYNVDISGNKLTQIPSWFKNESIQGSLSLNKNELSTLPEWFSFKFNRVTYLGLSNNEFVQVPEELREKKFIKTLDLSNNQISRLPKWLFEKLENSPEIRLNNNQIRYLPENFELTSRESQYDRLILILSNNLIEFIPYEVLYPKIRILDLSYNRISSLPEWFFTDTQDYEISFEDTEKLKTTRDYGKTNKPGIIYLYGNPLVSPTPEVISEGYDAILKYFEEKVQEANVSIEEAIAEAKGKRLYPNRALSMFNKILEKDPTNISALFWMTQAVHKSAYAKDKRKYLEQILEIDARNIDARNGLRLLDKEEQFIKPLTPISWIEDYQQKHEEEFENILKLKSIKSQLNEIIEKIDEENFTMKLKYLRRNFAWIWIALALISYNINNEAGLNIIISVLFIVIGVGLIVSSSGINNVATRVKDLKEEKKKLEFKIMELEYSFNTHILRAVIS